MGRASSPSTLFRYSRLECGFKLDQMRIIVQDSCSIVEYHPLLSRTLAVLSRQRTALLSLESLTSSQLCSGVYDHNGSDDSNHYVIDMSQAQPEDDNSSDS